MATITRREGSRGISYRVEIRRDGKRLSRSFTRKRDAEAFARTVEGNLDQHRALLNPEMRNNTLADLLDRYIGVWTGKDGTTLSRLAWWRAAFGERALAEIDGDAIREGLERLRLGKVRRYQGRAGVEETDKPRSPATINRYLTAIGGAYRVAIKRGWYGLRESPARGIGRDAENNDRHGRRLSEEERARLLAACDASQWPGLGLVVRLALSTGMRRGEIESLRWPAVDLRAGTITLIETKNKDVRLVPIIPELVERLDAWGKVRRVDTDLVFPSTRGAPRPANFERAWELALQRARVSDFRFHDLRHSAASFLTDAGVNHVVIAEILGHRTLQMVKRYSHAGLEAKRDALRDAMRGKLG